MVVDDPTTTLFFDGETVEPSVRLSSGYVKLEGLDYDLEDVWNNMLPVKSSSGKTTKKAKKTETENRKRNHASISCDDHIISGACEEEAEVEADPQVGRKDPVSVSFCGELVERVLYTNGFNKKVCVDNGDDDGPRVALKADGCRPRRYPTQSIERKRRNNLCLAVEK